MNYYTIYWADGIGPWFHVGAKNERQARHKAFLAFPGREIHSIEKRW